MSADDVTLLREMYRQMLAIRRIEEAAAKFYSQGKMGGFLHLGIGQESVCVGAMAALRKEDYVIATYREHGHAMAKAGVLAMTRSLAVEWGDRGIRLNAIAPGPFPTEGAWERLVPKPELAALFESKNPQKRVGRHDELTNLAAFLMSDAVGFINGEVVTIDGGEWLQGAGQFNFVGDHMSDADWQALRTKK